MKLDIVFIIPVNRIETHQDIGKKVPVSEPPAFTLLHAEYLKRKGLSVRIVDMSHGDIDFIDVADAVRILNPWLAVVVVYGTQPSSSTQNMPAARTVIKTTRQLLPDIPIMITGTHPAALPERTLEEEEVDFVCTGEGPITFLETVEALKNHGDLQKVRGLAFFNDFGLIVKTPSAPLVTNLDSEMPAGDWSLVNVEKYVAHDWLANYAPLPERLGYASIVTSFGCPFKCPFCCIQAPFREGERLIGLNQSDPNSYRLRNPKTVVEEISLLVEKYGIRHFKIHDEMFVLNPRHVLGIVNGIAERFGDSLNIWAYARIDTAKKNLLEPMRHAGITWLGLGIESADGTVRDGQDKSFTDEKILQVVREIDSAGINPGCNYIFGLENDTFESMESTLGMAIAINSPYANLYSAMPYPGSALYEMARLNCWPLPEDGGDGWVAYSQHAYETRPSGNRDLSPADVLKFRDEAWFRYHKRVDYLTMLKNRPGFGDPAVEHMKMLLGMPPLRRKLLGD